MSSNSRARWIWFLVWLVGAAGYGAYYVQARIHSNDAVGYEASWDFQLAFLLGFQGPFMLAILIVGLLVIHWLR